MENGSRESSSAYSPIPTNRNDVQRNSSYRNMSAEVEQVVTRLLRTTKALLEALNLWSQLRKSPTDIFDLHRTLESEFYLVSQSFESVHVNTSDLTWIPHQLRQSVMECMEQEPSTVALDRYLPRIRDAIVHLLHGLKGKQQELRDTPMPSPPGVQRDSYRRTTPLHYSDSTQSARHYSPTMPGERLTRSDYDPYASGMPQPNANPPSYRPIPRQTMSRQEKQPPVSAPAQLGKVDENDQHNALAALKRQENLARRSSVRRTSMYRQADSKRPFADAPPVPLLDRVDENTLSVATTHITASPSSSERTDNRLPSPSPSLTLYLQMDQQTKKVAYAGEITLPALSMLFIESFGYTGQHDFPSIYIRDPTLPHVSYELQDLAEVTDKSVLSLTLQDQKEDKSMAWVNSMVKEWNETQGTMLKQMERLEQKIGQQEVDMEAMVQQVVRHIVAITPPPTTADEPSEPPTANQTTENTSDNPPPSTDIIRIQEDAKIQQQQQRDEIEKLQRQIMLLRQAQTDQQEEHAKTLANLEEENQQLKERRTDEPPPPSQSRHSIEQGKADLLTSSDKITSRLEDLQDDIDHLKLDVTQRKCRPSEAQMEHCREERKALANDIDAFGNYINKVKPIWKKTWEQELQTIVKEQQTLKEQEGLLLDMNDDLAALQEVFENLEKICKFQEKSARHPTVRREFHVPPPDDGFEGMASVFKQVATIDVDHDRRLKALDMADRMRQRELANRTDEFEQELSNFVGSKKLKKTGGAMEIDRLRQEKDEAMRQQLYKEKQQQQEQLSGGTTSLNDGNGVGDDSDTRDTLGSNDKNDGQQEVETVPNTDGPADSENVGTDQESSS